MSDSPVEGEEQGPVVRDKRRFDPQTGEVREAAAQAAAPAPEDQQEQAPPIEETPSDEFGLQLDAVAELTADLQRLQAEFANYRRRVERDRQAVAEQALGSVILGLLPVLDDIDRARSHGEVEGGFKLVAD